jgi:hypothetical protein
MICADFDIFILAITPPRGAREQGLAGNVVFSDVVRSWF